MQTSTLASCTKQHLATLAQPLRQIVDNRAQRPFHPDVFSELVDADRTIGGPGLHTAVWTSGRGYRYPFDKQYEQILRPLRYMPALFWDAYDHDSYCRMPISLLGGYLEGCARLQLSRLDNIRRKPLGQLIQRKPIRQLFDQDQWNCLFDVVRTVVNESKHGYQNPTGPTPVFSFADALYTYFLARHFGTKMTRAAKHFEPLNQSVQDAIDAELFFRGAPMSVGHDAGLAR